jgi:hypothetical protein
MRILTNKKFNKLLKYSFEKGLLYSDLHVEYKTLNHGLLM